MSRQILDPSNKCVESADLDHRWKLPTSNRAGRIVGFYLLNFFSSASVQCVGLGTANVAGYTKKTITAAGLFVGYSAGNIIGPELFDA